MMIIQGTNIWLEMSEKGKKEANAIKQQRMMEIFINVAIQIMEKHDESCLVNGLKSYWLAFSIVSAQCHCKSRTPLFSFLSLFFSLW
uniref:Uncharacterized protein n=1 Tax=Oryza brachyantha TaxID=4533 RepID=J3MI30_ORYBR